MLSRVHLARELDGWGWWYRKYAPGNTVLEGLEIDGFAEAG